jgi:hypothetical protein
MTPNEFLAWEETQDLRNEYVNGESLTFKMPPQEPFQPLG